jgi:hypothetical protein
MYYLTIATNLTKEASSYQVSVMPVPDGGENVASINVG